MQCTDRIKSQHLSRKKNAKVLGGMQFSLILFDPPFSFLYYIFRFIFLPQISLLPLSRCLKIPDSWVCTYCSCTKEY